MTCAVGSANTLAKRRSIGELIGGTIVQIPGSCSFQNFGIIWSWEETFAFGTMQ